MTSRASSGFHSILFDDPGERKSAESRTVPRYFIDLNLDQIVDAIVSGKEEYNLKPFFYAPLAAVDAITYRHEVMRDLETGTLLDHISTFAQGMRSVRDYLAQIDKLHYRRQKESWFLDAVALYCDAVSRLSGDLDVERLRSRGFLKFRTYLAGYVASERFARLVAETKKLQGDLATTRYAVLIKSNSFTVQKYDDEPDYSAEVERTFEKFKQGAVKSYLVKFFEPVEMNHIEAKALDFVAQLNPGIFADLESYRARNAGFLDETMGMFDRDIQFYIAYLAYLAPIKATGLKFAYPVVSNTDKEIYDRDGFDLALAYKLTKENLPVITNDFYLQGAERILVVSGPNQGGKTTLARMFGQLHFLASIGCPVAGRKAQLFLFDQLFTHFEKEENISTLRGKLEDDLFRIHQILDQATPNSIIVMNEIFNSTALNDAVFLGTKVIERIARLDVLCVCVTFVEELASLNEKTVSMVSTVIPDNPATRTFKVARQPADGLSYAISIAEKYRLTYDSVKERVRS